MSAQQRNSSHNPLVAKALRLRQQGEQARAEAERAREARKEELREIGRRLDAEARERRLAKRAQEQAEARAARANGTREHGRILDQIETCYRQYTPAQQKHITLDDLYTDGTVVWESDTLVIKERS